MQIGKSTHLDAAMAKLYVSESFLSSCLDAVQVHGTAGYMTELEFERELRDAVGSRLYSGTSESSETSSPSSCFTFEPKTGNFL